MNDKYITLMSNAESKQLSDFLLRQMYGIGAPLDTEELQRYDILLTLQAEQDYENYWTDNNFSKAEAIRYLKAKVERDCFP